MWAQGSWPLENPLPGVVKTYGYDDNGPFVPTAMSFNAGPPATVSLGAAPIEATKTEPDKNTYLVLDGQKGADPNYDYGRHFLYQGHEGGSPGYITRINLDADGAHRVTLMATKDVTGANLPTFDGSTWDPFAARLLLTAEKGSNGGVWQSTLDVPSAVVNLQPFLGRGGFEGIQNDDRGSVYYVEDVGGDKIPGTQARRPNSFVYRFLPKDPSDLTRGGAIQALQVLGSDGQPITFDDGGGVVNPPKYVALHAYGSSFKTKWVTIATTTSASTLPGPDDNALAKKAGATPFKRPENGLFQPGTKFTKFYFDETGDTNKDSTATQSGGFGAVFTLTQSPTSGDGTISVFYNGDVAHSGFDNMAFFSDTKVAFVEDAGDTLHTQRNALDSGYMFDTTANYANPANKPVRFLAEGRDASATLDSSLGALSWPQSNPFPNDGDNEITGLHVSDGDPSKHGVLGAKTPKPFSDGWRVFWTQQHGDNVTYELIPWSGKRSDDGRH